MHHIQVSLSRGLIDRAYAFSNLRAKCKSYLAKHNLDYDKFTAVSHDSFTGFISEYYVKNFLVTLYNNTPIYVTTWEEQFDLKKINHILSQDSELKEDINYVKEFFYDRYDLVIENGRQKLYIDVKTALTRLNPTYKWSFLYPVIQAHKKGKDVMILVYFVVEDIMYPESLKEIVLAGFVTEEKIKKCSIIRKGEKTKFGTVSRIDNYITELSHNYNTNFNKLESLLMKGNN